jgi:hypothetical protein
MATLIHLLTSLTALFLSLMALFIFPALALIGFYALAPEFPECSFDAVWSKEHVSIKGNCREITQIQGPHRAAEQRGLGGAAPGAPVDETQR